MSIRCELCDGESSVVDSRPMQATVRRRRRCDSCGHKWSTFEIGRESMMSIRELPSILAALSNGHAKLQKVHAELSEIVEAMNGGQGPTKTKRELRPRTGAPIQ